MLAGCYATPIADRKPTKPSGSAGLTSFIHAQSRKYPVTAQALNLLYPLDTTSAAEQRSSERVEARAVKIAREALRGPPYLEEDVAVPTDEVEDGHLREDDLPSVGVGYRWAGVASAR